MVIVFLNRSKPRVKTRFWTQEPNKSSGSRPFIEYNKLKTQSQGIQQMPALRFCIHAVYPAHFKHTWGHQLIYSVWCQFVH